MSTYKGIQGTAVQNYAGDLPGAVDGQVWYDSTASNFKYNLTTSFTGWVTGGNMGTARSALAGCGTQTAGLAFGGTPITAATEEYGGTSWTAGGNLGTARKYLGGCGTQTAGLAFGGFPPNTASTEEYDGSA